MAYKATIKDAQRFDSLADGKTYIDVTYEVIEDSTDEVVSEYRESFPLDTTSEDIQEYLTKKLSTLETEHARAEEQRKIDEAFSQSDATIEALKGFTK